MAGVLFQIVERGPRNPTENPGSLTEYVTPAKTGYGRDWNPRRTVVRLCLAWTGMASSPILVQEMWTPVSHQWRER
jgi:hypothetical protein